MVRSRQSLYQQKTNNRFLKKNYDSCRDSFYKPAESSDNPFRRFQQQLSVIK